MNNGGVITVDVREMLSPMQSVYDIDKTKVGEVSDVNLETGWVTIAPTPLSVSRYYVPFTLISYIDPQELFLNTTAVELASTYANPPARSTSVEGAGAEQTAVTMQASGYGTGSVLVQQTQVNELRNTIGTGFVVFTSDGASLGEIVEYDATTGLMMLDKGPFAEHEIVVPITVVGAVDAARAEIRLVASKADVDHMTPVTLVRTAATVANQN